MPDSSDQIRVDKTVEKELDRLASDIETLLDADVMGIFGDIFDLLDVDVRDAIENRTKRSKKLAVVLDTMGGVIEIVERMVQAIRHHYHEVIAIVPDRAMSAGTVFAMSADKIMMDYFSCLGPIDPQIPRGHKLVPAKSYLAQYEALIDKAQNHELTTPEIVLLQQLDLGELHSFKEAEALSISLLEEWLAKYKFKDWIRTEGSGKPVDAKMREERAGEIATKLMDQGRWHSHGRPISMATLTNEIGLKIDDFGADPKLSDAIKTYHRFLYDYMGKIGAFRTVHTQGTFLPLRGGP
ncbi:MAG: serine dehydrogenasease [Planctomycetes bacterium]|nr:serine dehydrogenasease [Planctomycetota bacterium]